MVTKDRLEAVLERIRPCLEDEGDIELVSSLLRMTSQPSEAAAPAVSISSATPISLDDRLRELEGHLIRWALKASGGNKSRAAELLQIKRSTLGDRIRRCGLDTAAPSTNHAPDAPAAQL